MPAGVCVCVCVLMHEFIALFFSALVSLSSVCTLFHCWLNCLFSWAFLVSKVLKSSLLRNGYVNDVQYLHGVFVINIKVICANSLAKIHGNSCIHSRKIAAHWDYIPCCIYKFWALFLFFSIGLMFYARKSIVALSTWSTVISNVVDGSFFWNNSDQFFKRD